MNMVRVGVVGLGNMGLQHAGYLHNGSVDGATLGALCNRGAASLAKAAAMFPNVPTFTSLDALLAAGVCDAVLMATPHFDHPQMILTAFAAGKHVLVEKPLAVSIKAAREVVAVYERYPHLKFGIMYNQRSNPLYQKIRELISSGEIGDISRITWIITNWFRTNAYYRSSSWRATWKGEGGGVLINQCPHNLDLLWWMTRLMPSRITAIAHAGKFHPIEVEDEVNAIFEYDNGERQGATGHFITTTGEFPGTNRLEIAGSRAKIVAENNTLTLTRSAVDSREFSRSSPESFGAPASTQSEFRFPPPAPHPAEHLIITQDFVNAIRHERPNIQLLAPAPEGIYSQELANGMMMAGLTRKPVKLPLDVESYEEFLRRLIESGASGATGA
jgi:predicted dehydrogenase